MPLQETMKLISVDDHIIEHPRVWSDRLPSKYRDVGPRVVEVELNTSSDYRFTTGETAEVWVYEGRQYPSPMLDAAAGRRPEDWSLEPRRYADIRPGCYDPSARLQDMDTDGVWAQLCFPTFPRFGGRTFVEGEDKILARLCVEAYNDFILDEWCAAAPDRYIPMIIVPVWDPTLAAREIERCAEKGARAITVPENPVPIGLPSFHTEYWDPMFAAAQAADMPLCMHFGSSGQVTTTAPDAPFPIRITLQGCNSMSAAVDLLFSRVFHNFPGIKIALSEGGIGWVPYILERADYVWDRHRYYTGVDQTLSPSELFRRHFWGCFIEDRAGLRERHLIGVDRILWECDYPHADSNWPHTRRRATENLADVPDDEVRMMVEHNARQLFHFYD